MTRKERLIIDFKLKGNLDLIEFYKQLYAKLNELQNQGIIEDYRIIEERIKILADFSED